MNDAFINECYFRSGRTPSVTSSKIGSSTLGRRLNKVIYSYRPKYDLNFQQSSVISAIQSAGSTPALQNGAGSLRRNRIQRRHSTFQPKVDASGLDTGMSNINIFENKLPCLINRFVDGNNRREFIQYSTCDLEAYH
jgi:hypothetical protein